MSGREWEAGKEAGTTVPVPQIFFGVRFGVSFRFKK